MSDTRKRYKRIADSIAEEIRSGVYTAGDRLPTERELAVQFKVSRPTLREAMIALEILGYIEARQGHGIVVRAVSPDPLPMSDSEIGAFELIEARRLFESEVAALAATLISDEQLDELKKLARRMEDPSPAISERADREFHMLIAQVTGNGAIVSSVENLWDWRYRSPLARNILARTANLGMKARVAEHSQIIEALEQRSPEAARQAMREHMDRVIEHLLATTELVEVEKARAAGEARRKALAKRFLKA
ncbi:FadR/GntR family transcriptional regulator [Asticcacaulis sp.]|uniref:FadR/GntR family transcriptional regulator n=1 Tax=Asticcacaulis sp. TaxID=1872648 RepID=UPI0031D9C70E